MQHGGGSPGPDGATVLSVSLSGRQTGTRPVAVSQVGQDDADWWDEGGGVIWQSGRMPTRQVVTLRLQPVVEASLGWLCGVRAGPAGVQFEGEIMSAGRPL